MPVLTGQFVNSAENHLTHGYGKKTANMNVEPHGQNATMEDNPHTHVKDTIKQGSDVQGQFTNKQEKPSSYIHDVITPYHSWAQVQQRPTDKQNPPFPNGHHTVAAGQNATKEDNPHPHVRGSIKQGSDIQGQFNNKQEKPFGYTHDVITPYHSWAQVQQRPTDKQNPPFPKGHHTVAAGQNVAQAQPKPTSSQFINEVEIDRLVEEVAKRLQHSPNKSKNDANPSGGIHAAKRYFFIYCEITFCITTPGKGM
jgi:hypothetical protein